MIQRIQSVYLSVVVLAGILVFFFPIASFLSDLFYYKFFIYGMVDKTPDSKPLFTGYFALPLIVLQAGAVLLSAFTVFKYRNRLLQIRLINIAILLDLLLIVLLFFMFVPAIEKKLGVSADYVHEFGVYFPLVSLVFLVLANRAVRKDEKLVRAADRLR